jgi:hypothetical protein
MKEEKTIQELERELESLKKEQTILEEEAEQCFMNPEEYAKAWSAVDRVFMKRVVLESTLASKKAGVTR